MPLRQTVGLVLVEIYLVNGFWVFRYIKDNCSGSPLNCSLGLVNEKEQVGNSVFWPCQHWPYKSGMASNVEPDSKQYLCPWASFFTFPHHDIRIWKTGNTATYFVLSFQEPGYLEWWKWVAAYCRSLSPLFSWNIKKQVYGWAACPTGTEVLVLVFSAMNTLPLATHLSLVVLSSFQYHPDRTACWLFLNESRNGHF